MLVLLPLLTRWFFIDTTMDNDYQVYELVTPDGMYYFGQTQNVGKRWSRNGARYKNTSLQPYIEQYGWDNIKHIVLFRDQTKEDALWIEDFLITTAREDGVCINKQRSGNISKDDEYQREYQHEYREQNKYKRKDYLEQNKDKIKEQSKQYREQNKEEYIEYQREYREQNKDKIKEYQREYYEQNKDKMREYKRQYYQRKKQEKQIKEVI